MLLQRLVEYSDTRLEHARPFHREREFRWRLDLDLAGRPLGGLAPLKDEQRRDRGLVLTVPAVVRTVGVVANLAADDAQYVLGWGDETTKPERVAQCHTAFVELIEKWAASDTGRDDETAQAVAEFYRSGAATRLVRPEEVSAKHGVVIAVNGDLACRSDSVIEFWSAEVATRKGGKSGTRHGLCLVCGRHRELVDTVPGKVPGRLVPGASNDTALVSVNERVFGYGLTTGLEHTPICFRCGDAISTGLVAVLSSPHSIAPRGQNSRVSWWYVGEVDDDPITTLDQADPDDVSALLSTVHTGRRDENPPDVEMFCSLTVAGNIARIMVRDWIEMPLIELKRNIAAWFDHHEIAPAWPTGRRHHPLWKLALATGRWQGDRNRYTEFGIPGGARPHNIHQQLLGAALRNKPIPPAVLAHLIGRIRADGHLDDSRAALLRLALVHGKTTKETIMPDLDPGTTDTAYQAGRAFALLEQIQHAAGSGERVNSTYGDRFFSGAITNPRAALVTGSRNAKAWQKKLRRSKPGLANYFDRRLDEVFALIPEGKGLPAAMNLRQQAQFLLGYHHQRGHRTTTGDGGTDSTPDNGSPTATA
ncbi:type I-C CRISPR-associated protein Cas8c/Csd1 [Actinosynnema sp. CS-041913]|uniref:type I-C CRISPR-associated protein Cas8c/Csd1 n=1 Tax=Actinosynnema sp. CS-041913 TaxID=3239917 RepID=UPI003D93CA98